MTELALALDASVEQSVDLRVALGQLIVNADAEGLDTRALTQEVRGRQNVQAAYVTDSSVNVNYGTPRG